MTLRIRSVAEIARDADLAKSAENLENLVEKIESDVFRVLVIGEFNTGKSTLINALLGDELLPARIDPTTAVIGSIGYGKDLEIFIRTREGGRERISRDLLEEYLAIAPDDRSNLENAVEKVEIAFPSKFCQYGVRIVDSPGLNEDRMRNEITHAYVPGSDAVILALSALQLCTAGEMRFIQNSIVGKGHEHVFFVVNKIDLVQSEKDREDLNRRAAEKLAPLCKTETRLFFVSAADALDGKIESDENLIAGSRFGGFEKELERFLAGERGKAAMQSPIRQTRHVAGEVARLLKTRSDLEKLKIDELERRIGLVEPKFSMLNEKKNAILGRVMEKKDSLSRMISYDFENKIMRMRKDLNAVVLEFELQKKWDGEKIQDSLMSQFNGFVEKEIESWAGEIEQTVGDQLEELFEEIGEEIDFVGKALEEIECSVSGIPDAGEFEKITPAATIGRMLNSGDGLFQWGPEESEQNKKSDLKGMARQIGLQVGAGVLLRLVGISNPFILFGAVVFSGISGVLFKQSMVDRKIKEEFAEGVKAELSKLPEHVSPEIRREVGKIFDSISVSFEQGIDLMTEDVKNMLDAVANEKKKQAEVAETEVKALNEYRERLQSVAKEIEQIAGKFEYGCEENENE